MSDNGENIESFKKVLVDLDYKPVVHLYIAEKELDVFPYFTKLLEEGFIRKAEYSEFIEDEDDAELYEQHFSQLYEEMRKYLEIKDQTSKSKNLQYQRGKRYTHIGELL